MATKFGEKNPWPEHSALLGSKVMQGSYGVNQGSNCLEMPYGHQIWWEESLTKALWLAEVKGHVGVRWGQVGVNLLSNAVWPPNLVGRTPDQRVMHCWGWRSCRGQLGSRRGQFASQCPMATKFGGKNPWPECYVLLGSKVMQGSSMVNQGSNCLEMPYGHQIWWGESWPKCNALLESKVMKGSVGVK